MKLKKITMLVLILMLVLVMTTNVSAKFRIKNLINKANFRKVIKVALVGSLVERLAKPINKFINTLLRNKGVPNKEMSKVVPILTVGRKGYIGAAQICGPKELLDKVQSVVQFEDQFSGHRGVRVKALIPNSSKSPTKVYRVYGVGVTAIIDLPL